MPLHLAADNTAGPEKEPVAYDVVGAAEAAGLGRSSIYEAMDDGGLPAFKHGRRTVILRDDLVSWLRTLPPRPRPRQAA